MSVKELILISKQKYNLLRENKSPETVSVQTQTDTEEPLEVQSQNETTSPGLYNELDNKIVENGKRVQAVRSPSWSFIPGVRPKKLENKTKKVVKWIPY